MERTCLEVLSPPDTPRSQGSQASQEPHELDEASVLFFRLEML